MALDSNKTRLCGAAELHPPAGHARGAEQRPEPSAGMTALTRALGQELIIWQRGCGRGTVQIKCSITPGGGPSRGAARLSQVQK